MIGFNCLIKNRSKALILMLLLSPLSSMASLGGDSLSAAADQKAMNGTTIDTPAAATSRAYTTQTFQLPNGTLIREYSAWGSVFGVMWTGPYLPNLEQLLGKDGYKSYLSAASHLHKMSRQLSLESPDLVIHSSGRPGAFAGQAYLPKMLPQGVSANDIK
jgi:hypothetical protein